MLKFNYFRLKQQLALLDESIESLKETERLAKERLEKSMNEGGTVDEAKLKESEAQNDRQC